MHPFLASALFWIASPVYIAQGLYVRAQAMRLGPPRGPLVGQAGTGRPEINLLAIGDSSAAGIGLKYTKDTLAAQLAKTLHAQTNLPVRWTISGHNSAIAGELRDLVVPNLRRENFTHVVLMIGTNDIKNAHTVRRWKREFGGLIYAVRARFPEAKIYWPQPLDMRDVPSLPWPLSDLMNLRRLVIDRMGGHLCIERGAVTIPTIPDVQPEGFCEDGFHAGPEGYHAWAAHMAEHMLADMMQPQTKWTENRMDAAILPGQKQVERSGRFRQ